MILCIGLTPAAQRVMVLHRLHLNGVNRAAATLETAAGKSVNVAKVLKTLGEHPVACGFLGGGRGDFVRAELEARSIEQDFVRVAAQTRQCLTVIDEATGTQTELVQESLPVSAADYEVLEGILRRRIGKCRAIVLSGSLTPGGPQDFYERCLQMSLAAELLSVVDAQGPPLANALKAKPNLVKPNHAELAATVGRELRNEGAVLGAMRELHERGAQRVVVTAGKHPTLAFDGQRAWRIALPAVEARNPIGSGDAFTAGLLWRLLQGEELCEACRWACAVGTANALTLLPGEVERAEVERLVGLATVKRVT